MRARLVLISTLASGCASLGPPARYERAPEEPPAQPPPVPAELRVKPSPEFERIIGSFSPEPTPLLFLNPELLADRFDPRNLDDGFGDVAGWCRYLGVPRPEAAARLNWGGVLWF